MPRKPDDPFAERAGDDLRVVTRVDRPSGAQRSRPPDLPDDLLRDSARRLRVIALIYAMGFAVAVGGGLLADPLLREDYTRFSGWGPAALSIVAALAVVGTTYSVRIAPATLMNVGLAFEVVAAYGIAMASYWGVYEGLAYEPEHLEIFGLSYVAAWIMFFTIVSPNKPKRALLAAAAAGSAVPVTLVLTIRYGGTSLALTPSLVVSGLLVPYVLIVATAWVGARVVYSLGTAVTEARDLGSYRLTQRLGGGGMGEVWEARHRMLARPAAIKLIRPDVLGGDDPGGRRALQLRFEREAQATALLRSPHTVELYDFGVTAEGTFYYVMELLHGFDLETLVDRFGPMPAGRAVHVLRQVCDSLAEAHENGLTHRDVKPANIYLCYEGRRVDAVKVLDFGLVKPQRDRRAGELTLSAEHMASGTPAYMAPEQISGEPVDARTDLYALGCVGYFLLTGSLVFRSRSSVDMLASHLHTVPTPPSQVSELSIPEPLEAAVLACLEKDPARRPQSADAMEAALAGCVVDPPWTKERAQAWWDLHQPEMVERRRDTGRLVRLV